MDGVRLHALAPTHTIFSLVVRLSHALFSLTGLLGEITKNKIVRENNSLYFFS